MEYIYSVSSDTLNAKINSPKLITEIEASSIIQTLDRIDTNDDSILIVFTSALTSSEKTTLTSLVNAHDGIIDDVPVQIPEVTTQAFSSNMLVDGKTLYLKIHGMKAIIQPNSSHEFLLTIPYGEVYLQGAEIFVDILAQTDMSVKHPIAGVIEQYGYDVCMGKVIYKREAKYAARLPMGLQISAICTNVEPTEQEMGVNFILHEIRDPNV